MVLPTILDEESVADPIREVVVVQNSALQILDWVTLLSIVISSTVFLHVINRDTSSAPKVVLQGEGNTSSNVETFFPKAVSHDAPGAPLSEQLKQILNLLQQYNIG